MLDYSTRYRCFLRIYSPDRGHGLTQSYRSRNLITTKCAVAEIRNIFWYFVYYSWTNETILFINMYLNFFCCDGTAPKCPLKKDCLQVDKRIKGVRSLFDESLFLFHSQRCLNQNWIFQKIASTKAIATGAGVNLVKVTNCSDRDE